MAQKDVLSTTLELRAKKYVDSMMQKLPLTQAFSSISGGRDMVDGGYTKGYPIVVRDHAGIVEHTTGYEPTVASVADVSEKAAFDFYMWSTLVAITRKDRLENTGMAAQLQLLDMRLKTQLQVVLRAFEAHYIRNQGAFSSLLSLDGCTAGATTGFLEDNTVALQANTVGGLSKATFNPYLSNQYIAITDWTTDGMEKVTEAETKIWTYAVGEFRQIGLFSEAMFNLYLSSLETQRRFVKRDVLDSGIVELVNSNGNRVRPTPSLGTWSGGDSGLPISGYFIDIGGIFEIINRNANWTVDPPEKVSGQLITARDVVRHGQLGFQMGMRSNAVIVNGEV